MALICYSGVKSGEEYESLKKMCYIVFQRHYSIYRQYYEEMLSNAVAEVYASLIMYDHNMSFINYIYTVIRNSYTKDVNKYKKTFVRENQDFRNEVSKHCDTEIITIKADKIKSYIKRFRLNVKHSIFLLETLRANGIRTNIKYKRQFLNTNEQDEDYINRVIGVILYDYYEEIG